MSTDSGSSGSGTCRCSPDMLDPVLVLVHLAANGRVIHLLNAAGYRSGPAVAQHPVVDGLDGHDLGGRAGQERLVGDVQVRPQDVLELDVEAEVAGDGDHRILGDAL